MNLVLVMLRDLVFARLVDWLAKWLYYDVMGMPRS